MKTKTLFKIAKALFVSIIVLGLIHDVATFTPLIQGGLGCLDIENFQAVIYFSLICGTSLILCGWLLFQLLSSLAKSVALISLMQIIGIFLLINGFVGVVCMINNPFAWLAFVLNVGAFLVILALKKRLC